MNITQIIAAAMELTREGGKFFPTIHLFIKDQQDVRDVLNYARWHDVGNWDYELLSRWHNDTVTAHYLGCICLFIPLVHFEAWLREGE